jgi:hypothetical protein
MRSACPARIGVFTRSEEIDVLVAHVAEPFLPQSRLWRPLRHGQQGCRALMLIVKLLVIRKRS